MICSPWVTFMTALAVVHGVWVSALLCCQLYQILWLGVTTNERLNFSRYSYFGHGHGKKSECKKSSKNVFNRSVIQNFIDFFELDCFRTFRKVDWVRSYAPISSHTDDYQYNNSDVHPLVKDKRDNYQYV